MEIGSVTRLLVWSGIAACFVYAVTVAVGAVIRPGYSHTRNAISELIGFGAPNRLALTSAFFIYNLLFVAFGIGVLRAFSDSSPTITIAAWLLIGTGVLGITMSWFPMDRVGSTATIRGIGHLVLAGMMSLGTMASVLCFAIGSSSIAGWNNFSTYSYSSLIVVVVTGGLAAFGAARRWRVMGLLERFTIGASLQWVAMLAFVILQ